MYRKSVVLTRCDRDDEVWGLYPGTVQKVSILDFSYHISKSRDVGFEELCDLLIRVSF